MLWWVFHQCPAEQWVGSARVPLASGDVSSCCGSSPLQASIPHYCPPAFCVCCWGSSWLQAAGPLWTVLGTKCQTRSQPPHSLLHLSHLLQDVLHLSTPCTGKCVTAECYPCPYLNPWSLSHIFSPYSVGDREWQNDLVDTWQSAKVNPPRYNYQCNLFWWNYLHCSIEVLRVHVPIFVLLRAKMKLIELTFACHINTAELKGGHGLLSLYDCCILS